MRISLDATMVARMGSQEALEKLRAAEVKHPLCIRLLDAIEEVVSCLDAIIEAAAAVSPEVRATPLKRQ